MRRIAPQFDEEHARRWHDRDAAENYRYRIPYPAETFDRLLSLIADTSPAVLDVGCGPGNIARELAPRVTRVDAIDFSAAMIEVGRGLPGGSQPNIRWQEARAEEAELDPPYALIVGGASLHWMDYEVVLPRLARALTERGVLAVVSVHEQGRHAWDEEISQITNWYSTAKRYVPFDMIRIWEEAGLFEQADECMTGPVSFEQPVEEYIAGFHAVSNLARASIHADAFDAKVRRVMGRHCPDGVVRRAVAAHLVSGVPLVGPGA